MTNLKNQARRRWVEIGIALALGILVVMVSIPGCQRASDVATSADPALETVVADETDELAEEVAVVSVPDPEPEAVVADETEEPNVESGIATSSDPAATSCNSHPRRIWSFASPPYDRAV